jgi:putative peptidoglycan lipid II flippase
MGVLNSYSRFLMPAIAPAVYNLCIILGAWVLGPRMGVHGLAVGVILGSMGHLAVQVPAVRGLRPRFRLALDPGFGPLREVVRLMIPRSLGLGIVQINFLVNTILASGLPAGSLSALNYAWLLMLLPQGILAQATATAVFPTLSTLAAQQRQQELWSTFESSVRALLFLTVPAGFGLLLLRRPLVQVLLEGGAFTPESTIMVIAALAFYALALPAHSALEVVARAFYALHDTLTPVLIGGLAVAANVTLSVVAIRVLGDQPNAHAYLALANALASTGEVLLLFWILRSRLAAWSMDGLGRSILRTMAATIAMGLVVVAAERSLAAFSPLVQLIAGVAVGGLTFLGAAAGLRSAELASVWQMVLSRVRR